MQLWNKVRNHCVPTKENAYRPGALARTSIVFFLAVTLAVEGFLVAGLVARESDNSFLSAVIASDVVTLTNAHRHDASLGGLQENTLLDDAAQAKALDMASRGYFSHVAPDGTLPWTWITSAGYDYQYAGENLAVRFNDATNVVNAWMASPTHRENILKPAYTQIGVGVADGIYQGQPATFVVQFFATPKQPVPGTNRENAATLMLAGPVRSLALLLDRNILHLLSDPVRFANWILGSEAMLLVVLVGVAFFVHIDIQPRNMIVGGLVVAAIAIVCVVANDRFLGTHTTQTAEVIGSLDGEAATYQQ